MPKQQSTMTTEQAIREATREANGVLKDIQRERKELEREWQERQRWIRDRLEEVAKRELDNFSEQLTGHVREAHSRINRRFDLLVDTLLGVSREMRKRNMTNGGTGASIPDMITALDSMVGYPSGETPEVLLSMLMNPNPPKDQP